MDNMEYDFETDAAYLKFEEGDCIDSDMLGRTILHYDQGDNVVAVEIIGLTKLDSYDWQVLQAELPEAVYDRLREFHTEKSSH